MKNVDELCKAIFEREYKIIQGCDSVDRTRDQNEKTVKNAVYRVGRLLGSGWIKGIDAKECERETSKAVLPSLLKGIGFLEVIDSGMQNPLPEPKGNFKKYFQAYCDEMPIVVRDEVESPPFPAHALGRVAGVAAIQIADQVQAPLAIAGSAVLAGMALAVCGNAIIVLPHGETKPINLYSVVLAESNARKSGVERRVLAFAKNAQKDLDDEFYERNEEDAKKAIHILTDSPTIASIFSSLINTPITGIFSDEGSGFVSGHSMRDSEKETLAALNKFYDGESPRNPRITRDTPPLHNRMVCLNLMMQPGLAAAGLMDNKLASQNGFLSRCLICQPDSLRGSRFSRERWFVTDEMREFQEFAKANLMATILNAKEHKNECQRRKLAFSDKAALVWWDYRDECEDMGAAGGDYDDSFAVILRSPENAGRIAGVLWEFSRQSGAEIDEETAKNAITIARWYRDEVIRIIRLAKPNDDLERADKLANWLKAQKKTVFKLAEIYQKSPIACKARSRRDALFLLGILQEHKHGKITPSGFELAG